MLSAKSCSSSTGTTSLRPDGGSAGWAWCFAPPMPCSFVDGHHVFGAKSDFGRLGVVLRSPQCLVLSSTGTTSFGQNGASAGWAWCFAPRNALFFRRRAPRLRSKIGFGRLNVVLRSPQRLVLSSPGTTSLGQNGASAGWAWCFAPRNTLFFRRRVPRLWSKIGFGRLGVVLRSPQCLVLSSPGTTSSEQNRIRPVERGASLPAMPCSFVDGHHVFGAKSDSAG